MHQVWIWTAGVLGAAGLALLLWALFADRSRGRARCPGCWYDLPCEVKAGVVCPECGRVVRREREAFRTRRRRGWAWVAMLTLLGAAGSAWWGLTPSRGYLWPLPIELVTALIAVEANDDGLCGREVRMRLGAFPRPDGSAMRTATAEDGARVLRRVVRGVPGARPASKRWQQSYAQFLRGYRFALYMTGPKDEVRVASGQEGEPPPELLRAVEEQLGLPYVLRVRTRDHWPSGREVHIEFDIEHWWTTTSPYFRVSSPSHAGHLKHRMANRGLVLAAFDEGETELELEIEVFNGGRLRGSTDHEPVGRERRTLRFTVGGSLDEVVPPIESEHLDEIMAQVIDPHIGRLRHVEYPGWRSMAGRGFDGVGISIRAEALHDGKVWMSSCARWVIGRDTMYLTGASSVVGFADYLSAHPDGWTVRIVSDPEGADVLLNDATRLWRGSFELPLRVGTPARAPVPRAAPSDNAPG